MRAKAPRITILVAYATMLWTIGSVSFANQTPPQARPLSALEKHMLIRAIEAQGGAISVNRSAGQVDFVAINAYKRALHEIFFLYWINTMSPHAQHLPDNQVANFVRLYAIEGLGPEYRCEDPLSVGDLLEKESVTDVLFSKAITHRLGEGLVPSDAIRGKVAYQKSAEAYQAWLAKLVETEPANLESAQQKERRKNKGQATEKGIPPEE